MLKRRRTVLCFVQGVRASVVVVVSYDIWARDANEQRYGRLKFATQLVDFCAPYEIGQKCAETVPHGAVLCTRGRSDRDFCSVLR